MFMAGVFEWRVEEARIDGLARGIDDQLRVYANLGRDGDSFGFKDGLTRQREREMDWHGHKDGEMWMEVMGILDTLS